MLPRSFYFLRHGETDWNKDGLIQGHSDIALNATGRLQAENAIEVLARQPIDRIVCSTLSRAQETAEIINAVLKKPLNADGDLKERNFGVLEGKRIEDMLQMQKDMLAEGLPAEENGYPCPAEAEPYAAFKERSLGVLSRYLDLHAGESIMFVAHGGIYRALKRCLFGATDMSPNVQPFLFEKEQESWRLQKVSL